MIGRKNTAVEDVDSSVYEIVSQHRLISKARTQQHNEFDEFKDALKEDTEERSELSKSAYETGRRLAPLAD